MTAVLLACAAFALGRLTRSRRAAVTEALLREQRAALRFDLPAGEARPGAESDGELRYRPGVEPWLLDALVAACGQLAPGERAETLTVQARWKTSREEILIGVTRGETEPERVVRYPVTDCEGKPQGWLYEDIEIPAGDSPEWVTG